MGLTSEGVVLFWVFVTLVPIAGMLMMAFRKNKLEQLLGLLLIMSGILLFIGGAYYWNTILIDD